MSDVTGNKANSATSHIPHPTSHIGDTSTHVIPKTYITSDQPPIGGVIKQRPEDFLVDEIPLYQPAGSGEHIYLLVQKRGLSTMEMVDIVAAHFAVPRKSVGYAGLKDKHAITRQVVSVHAPGRKMEDFGELRHEKISVLWADYHANKLRPGHLKGNRFSVRIRGVKPTDALIAQRVLATLARVGVPNRVGEQRFGLLENNHLVGRAIVLGAFEESVKELLGPNTAHPDVNADGRRLFAEGKYQEAVATYPRSARTEQRVLHQLARRPDARRAIVMLDEPILRYYLSAFQSAVFNRVLDARVAAGTLGSLREGDLAVKHENGAVFAVTPEVGADAGTAARLASFEISPSGPMWGGTMMRAAGETDRTEVAALESFGVTVERLQAFDAGFRFELEGKRRALRVPVIAPEVEGGVDEHGSYVRCAFELPRGSFATVVLREIMKPEGARGAEWEEE
jgi:tRNA pseudouridine13 synthase